ncbi:hypothetical protein ElyMa_000907800 [Elysia marginata]|uniref:IBB domain-containing protein n=1 Tax=Elysia marginata TaxID=1093978 RepID=A0AAV4HA80_9GAST|nr:hypothetical protein ElyMa_000907800 [Elysia marginata]
MTTNPGLRVKVFNEREREREREKNEFIDCSQHNSHAGGQQKELESGTALNTGLASGRRTEGGRAAEEEPRPLAWLPRGPGVAVGLASPAAGLAPRGPEPVILLYCLCLLKACNGRNSSGE